jgi:hypothetical protein
MRFRDIHHAADLTEVVGVLADFIGDKNASVAQYQQIPNHT